MPTLPVEGKEQAVSAEQVKYGACCPLVFVTLGEIREREAAERQRPAVKDRDSQSFRGTHASGIAAPYKDATGRRSGAPSRAAAGHSARTAAITRRELLVDTR